MELQMLRLSLEETVDLVKQLDGQRLVNVTGPTWQKNGMSGMEKSGWMLKNK